MNPKYLAPILTLTFAAGLQVNAQTITINIPGEEPARAELTSAEGVLVRRAVLPRVRRRLARDTCEESFELAGVAEGSFTKANSKQRLAFYQFCQTGNGLGHVGLILIEGGKAIGSYVADAGWALGIKALPDINQDGLSEAALYYSGGLHQDAGGTGVDVVEFSASGVKAIGWFQAASFADKSDNVAYKITVRPGPTPAFYRERYVASRTGRWRRMGRVAPLMLQKPVSVFTAVR